MEKLEIGPCAFYYWPSFWSFPKNSCSVIYIVPRALLHVVWQMWHQEDWSCTATTDADLLNHYLDYWEERTGMQSLTGEPLTQVKHEGQEHPRSEKNQWLQWKHNSPLGWMLTTLLRKLIKSDKLPFFCSYWLICTFPIFNSRLWDP